MASTHTTNGATPFDLALEQFKDAGEQLAATARKTGKMYLESYERTVDRAIDLELKLVGLTEQAWLKNIVEAQAEVARSLNDSYATAAKAFLD
jgi:hypothetical protein